MVLWADECSTPTYWHQVNRVHSAAGDVALSSWEGVKEGIEPAFCLCSSTMAVGCMVAGMSPEIFHC